METSKEKGDIEYTILLKTKGELEERVSKDEENKKKVQEELESIKR